MKSGSVMSVFNPTLSKLNSDLVDFSGDNMGSGGGGPKDSALLVVETNGFFLLPGEVLF